MTPSTLLGSSASTAAGNSPAGTPSRSAAGGSDRRDFDALLKAEPAPKQPAAKTAQNRQAAAQGARDGASAAADAPRHPASTEPGETTDPTTTTTSAASDTPATPEPADDTDTAPWPPLGLAGLALGPEAVAVQAVPAANADTAIGTKADPLPGGVPATATLPTAAPLAATSAATGAPGPIALAPDTSVAEDAPLPDALADAIANAAGDAEPEAPAPTPFLHALHAAAELKANATNTPFQGDPTATPHVGGEDFDDAMSARIGWLADQKIGHATIKVTPHDLGQIEVRLQMDGDKVHASFSSAHAEVRHALESSIPRLREMLNEQGFQLGNADVGHQQTAQDGKAGGGPGPHASGDGDTALTETIVSPAQLMRQRGLLDAYA